MGVSDLILVISDQPEAERDALASVWEQRGGSVLRLGRFWDPPPLDANRVRVYGSTSFVLVLREKLGFALCSPADDLILSLPPEALKRWMEKRRLAEAEQFEYPLFVKPVAPKLFAARVYESVSELRRECDGLRDETGVLTSDVVTFVAEARAFVLDGEVLDCAIYEGEANVQEATAAASRFARYSSFPKTLVVDVGLIPDQGWAVIEFERGLGCRVEWMQCARVWPAIAAASGRAT